LSRSISEYVEAVMQFGYVLLFASALPISAAALLLGNILEVRGDLCKILCMMQRPVPDEADGIGAW